MKTVELICLANSRKLQGRCVAGLLTDGSGWIRPVSSYSDGTLTHHHYTLDNGTEAQIMDVIRLGILQHRPEYHQPENWVIAPIQWQLVQRAIKIQKYRDVFHKYRILGPELLGNDLGTFK